MGAFDVAVLALALWRITSLVTRERGPLDVFERLRAAVGIVHDDDHNITSWPDRYAANILICPWCFSMTAAFPLVALYVVATDAALLLCAPFAISAIVIMIHGMVNDD